MKIAAIWRYPVKSMAGERGRLCLNASVTRTGRIREGDAVEIETATSS